MTDQLQDENKLIAERRAKLDKIRENCKANGHPNDFRRDSLAADLQAKYGELSKEELAEAGHVVAIAGRIMAKRVHSWPSKTFLAAFRHTLTRMFRKS